VINFCVRCGSRVNAEAPCRCLTCGQEYWRNSKPCGGACVTRDGRLLLIRRAQDPAAGFWDLPGGFCEVDEHPRDTARRETWEETGLDVNIGECLGMWVDTYGDAQPAEYTLNIYFLAEAGYTQPRRTDEAVEFGWFAREAIPEELAFPHVRQAVAAWVDSAWAS
jgi:ADP-ribose pyrophosphatase YjhB (NUDIX family)